MSNKDFEKGMIAGARPYEAVYRKQEDALRRIEKSLGEKLDDVGRKAGMIIGDMNDMQRKELYGLNAPPIDLKDFAETEEKEYLLSGLYALAGRCRNGEPSPFQKAFIRSIQNHLGMRKPQTGIDLSKIASIDSGKTQRAIMQVFMEYLFLEAEDFSFQAEYSDVFAAFSVSEKHREEIAMSIQTVYKAVGAEGFIDKYGFAPEAEDSADESNGAPVIREKIMIDNTLHISADKEKVFTSKEISFDAEIHCEGTLVFDDCVIRYNGDDIKGHIRLEGNASLTFRNCAIIGENNAERKKAQAQERKYIVNGRNAGYKKTPVVQIENTRLHDCLYFLNEAKTHLRKCHVSYSKIFGDEFPRGLVSSSKEFCITHNLFNSVMVNSTVDNSIFECMEKSDASLRYNALLKGFSRISGCTFANIVGCIDSGHFGNPVDGINNCVFNSCRSVISGENADIRDCLFEGCEDVISGSPFGFNKRLSVAYSQFLGCSGIIFKVWTNYAVKINYCDFYNIVSDGSKKTGLRFSVKPESAGIFKDKHHSSCISNCTFSGIDLSSYTKVGTIIENEYIGFISCSLDKGVSQFKKGITGLRVENCKFSHCEANGRSEIIHRKNTESKHPSDETVISIDNCASLDMVNKEGKSVENPPIRHETGTGEPIGARLDTTKVGASGYTA